MISFKKNNTLEDRIAESTRIVTRYPDRVPVIITLKMNSHDYISLDKTKYLVPSDLSFGQLMWIIRKRVNLDATKAIFLFVNGIIIPSSEILLNIYKIHKDQDGFIYVDLYEENVFG